MEKKLIREIRFLKAYALVLTLVCTLFVIYSFTTGINKQRFEEIDVERINIIEKDGSLKMVISNEERQHPGAVKGKPFKPRPRPAGFVFFNSKGDECGGMGFEGDDKLSTMYYSFDQRDNDQVMQLLYDEDAGAVKNRTYGLKLWDRSDAFPLEDQVALMDSLSKVNDQTQHAKVVEKLRAEGKIGYERLFTGKTGNGDVGLFIRDDQGRPRIRIYIDKNNQPHLEYLDEKGKPIDTKKR